MKEPKICLGCFSEWEPNWTICPRCGWYLGKKSLENMFWKCGDVLEKRYLIGEVFYQSDDTVVWRAFDDFLRIPCFLLERMEKDKEGLCLVAECLMESNQTEESQIVVLALKKIGLTEALVFSMQNQEMELETFERRLRCKKEFRRQALIEKISYSLDMGEKTQVLGVGVVLGERYRIIGCIGIGGFGITYLGEDLLLHRNVALKEYFPSEWAERDDTYVVVKKSNMLEAYRYGMQIFVKEIRITAKFIHTPHIVTLYDVVKANDTIYIVMEYISGQSIGKEMREREYRPYSPEEMAEIILPVLDALVEIHEKSIVHSDISPGNIMRSDEGEICLIDMGAAKYCLESQPILNATFLKIDYAAPEQYRTAKEGIPRDEGPWTDIYAMGATMYYLLTGHKPTDVINRLNGNNTKLISPLKYNIGISEKWIQLIHCAMELESGDRIQSAIELKNEIRKMLWGVKTQWGDE